MRRQRAKGPSVPEVSSYRGRRLRRMVPWLAAAAALLGLVLVLIRPLGMRFSGFLLLGAATLLVMDLLLGQWAAVARRGRLWRRFFRGAVAAVLVPLAIIECYVLNQSRPTMTALPADAVIVLGAGVNGTEPSLSLRTRLDAALDYLERWPEIPVVLTGGQGYGEEITEAACMYAYLTEHGVDPQRLILEEHAGNTSENFSFSWEKLEQVGIDPARATVALVSNDFHIARARLIAQKQGYGHTVGVPAPLPWLHLEVNYFLREAFAVVKSLVFD